MHLDEQWLPVTCARLILGGTGTAAQLRRGRRRDG